MSFDPTETENSGVETPTRSRSGWILLALLIGSAVLLLGALSGVQAVAPARCARCHAAQSQSLAHSAHRNVGCETCHFSLRGQVSSRWDVLVRMSPASVGGVHLDGPGRPVGNSACLGCHSAVMTGGIVEENGLRISHETCAVASSCEDCHTESIHPGSVRFVRTPRMADCIACHVKRAASVQCAMCHQGKLPVDRVRDPEWARAHGPDWRSAHGTGDLASCAGCHASSECRDCHLVDVPHPANFGATHGKSALAVGNAACMTCHKQPKYCDGCHDIAMPHPRGFLQTHSSAAGSVDNPRCATCHVIDDCKTCHTYHVHPGGTQPYVGRLGDAK